MRGRHRAGGRTDLRTSAAWAVVMDSGGQVTSLAVTVLLAGLLGPEAYGLVAMALVFVLLVQLVQQQGLQSAVIQRKDLDRSHADTAFWMVVAVSVATTAAVVVLAPWWAAVNNEPQLAPVLTALSGLLPIRALATVQEALSRRRMLFRPLAMRTLAAVASGGLVGVAGALAGWGVWALVAQQLTTALVSVILLWSISPWRPGLRFSRRAARELMGFSSGSFVSSLGVFVNNRADALLIGIFFGPLVVGIYRFGGKLTESLLGMAVRPVQTVALPELSRHQDDPVRFRRQVLQLSAMSGWLALPALGVLGGAAGPIVALLGHEWSGAEWPLRMLCLVGVVRVVVGLNGPVLQARGLVFVQASLTWVTAAVSCASFVAAALVLRGESVAVQAAGLAASRALVYGVVVVLVHLFLLHRWVQVGLRQALRPFVPGLVVGLAAALFIGLLDVGLVGLGVGVVMRVLAAAGVGLVVVLVGGRRHLAVLTARRPRRAAPAGAGV